MENGNDKLTEVNNILDESLSNYFTDVYDLGKTKEQIELGKEVKENILEGSFDTSDSFDTYNNTYSLNIPTITDIFSLTVDGITGIYQPSSYYGFVTDLETKLGTDYIISYTSGTVVNISRTDGQTISISRPNLTKNIELTGFNTFTEVDLIIDGETININGSTHGGVVFDALTYVVGELTTDTYYYKISTNNLIIARKDAGSITLSKTEYNKYINKIGYGSFDPSLPLGTNWEYTDTTIEGKVYRTKGLGARRIDGDRMVRDLNGYTLNVATGWNNTTIQGPLTNIDTTLFVANTHIKINQVTKGSTCTATKAYIINSGLTILDTATFSGDTAIFSGDIELIKGGTYYIGVDNNGGNYNRVKGGNGLATEYITFSSGEVYNINTVSSSTISPNYNLTAEYHTSSGTESSWISPNTRYTGYYQYLYLNDTNYNLLNISILHHYSGTSPIPDDNLNTTISSVIYKADLTFTTYTEQTITLTDLGTEYFYVPIPFYNFKKIKFKVISTGGESEGEWTAKGQNCIAKYGTTVEEVTDKIFKTNASNYGNIIKVKHNGVYITRTTNLNNKITYIIT